MHIHSVYFWLADGLGDEDQAAFEQGLVSLTRDPHVVSGNFGKPADTDRDVIENSYSYGLVLKFHNLADHDEYQAGQAHLAFLDAHLDKWTKVVVYDIRA